MIVVDPRLNKVEMQHWLVQYLASYATMDYDMPMTGKEITLFDIAVTTTGQCKVELFENNHGYQLKALATLQTGQNQSTFVYSLGMVLPTYSTVKVRVTNFEKWPYDIAIMLRYSSEDLYEKYNREFTRALEAKLERET